LDGCAEIVSTLAIARTDVATQRETFARANLHFDRFNYTPRSRDIGRTVGFYNAPFPHLGHFATLRAGRKAKRIKIRGKPDRLIQISNFTVYRDVTIPFALGFIET